MSTTLINAEIELSKQLGDYWAGTTTSDGASGGTTLIDTALKAKANDWITDEAYDMLTEEPASAADIYEERKVSSLDNTTGTITVLAHGGQIASGIDYRIHRLFSASDKRTALIYAARHGFPRIATKIWDESIVNGNWLRDGSFEKWTTTTNLTNWTETTVTATQTTTSPYYKHGATSAKLSTLAGRISQGITNFDDLKMLAGKSVTFTVQGWSDTASCLRIQIYDGTTTTTSSYHDGNSAWTENNDPLTVTAQIGYNPTEITFRVLHDVAAGVSYVDDARVISDYRSRVYIGDLGLAKNTPHQVLVEPHDYSQEEDWLLIHGWKVDHNGYLYVPSEYRSDFRLRIRGLGYLDFLVSGASSTAWTATIDLDSPQLDMLVAEAALYLCEQKMTPNETSGDAKRWQEAYLMWKGKLSEYQTKFMAHLPASTVHWT